MFWAKDTIFSDLPYPGLKAWVIDNLTVTGL